MVFLAMVSFIIAIGVSIMLIWAAGVIQSMKFGKGRLVDIAIQILSVIVAIVGLFGIAYSIRVFMVFMCYLSIVQG